MQFKISDPKAREKILRQGMWNIAGVPMVVTKWNPRIEEEKHEEESIPMWIHLTKVPLNMFSWEGLSLIASPVGVPVKLHPETIACSSFKVAKVFVNVDVSKALPKEMNFSSKGKEFMVEFHYPWLPSRCQHCDKWGHGEKVCSLKRKGKEKEASSASKSKEVEGSKEVVDVGDTCKEGKEVIMGESSTYRVEEAALNTRTDDVVKWLQVSPGKVGRSAPKIDDSKIQISASKFTVLSINDE